MAKKRGNGEGCIRKRKDGKWEARFTNGRDPATGKLKTRSIYGKTRQEVNEKLTQALNDINQGTYVETNKVTLGSWLDTWLAQYAKPHIRPATWESYEMLIRVHIKPILGSVDLKKLQPSHLQKLYNDKRSNGRADGQGGLSSRSVELIHTVIHSALNQAVQEGILVRNVAGSTRLPRREPKEVRVLSLDEQAVFIKVLYEDDLGLAYLLDLGTGLRRGELLGLKWRDINLDEGIIRVTQSLSRVVTEDGSTRTGLKFQPLKTAKSQRSVPIPEYMIEKLNIHKAKQDELKRLLGSEYKDNDLVFCTDFGTPLEPGNFTRKFYKLIDKAGLDHINLHALRHTYATRLLELDENPKIIQELLGHSQISMTMNTYVHVLPERKQSAATKINKLFTDSIEKT